MIPRQTNHGEARIILHKEVLPLLEQLEHTLTVATQQHPAWEKHLANLRLARQRIEVAEKLLRQGG